MQFTTSATALLGLVSFVSAQWHISDLQASCRRGECSYSFNVYGEATDDLPHFEAQCSARTRRRDMTYRPCTITSQVSDHEFYLEDVEGFLSLAPLSPPNNKLSVQIKFNDGRGKVQWWKATQTGDYKFFDDGLTEFDVIPAFSKGIV